MDYEKIGEEFGFGTQTGDGFLWFGGDCASMLAYVRAAALEEAAKVCDHKKQWNEYYAGAEECAAAIRALASQPPER